MSSLYLTIYVKPRESERKPALAQVWDAIRASTNDRDDSKLNEIFACNEDDEDSWPNIELDLIVQCEPCREGADAICLELETALSFEHFELVDLFERIAGPCQIEYSGFESRSGTTFFVQDDAEYEKYGDANWRWLPPPDYEPAEELPLDRSHGGNSGTRVLSRERTGRCS